MNKDITLEDLGYRNITTSNTSLIEYQKPIEEEGVDICIDFDFSLKTIECYRYDREYNSYNSLEINMQELQSIYNKCKDFGWLDE